MIIKYRASWFIRPEIEIINVVKETKKYVWAGGVKQAKETINESYFNSFYDAKNWLMNRAENELNNARTVLRNSQGHYGNVKGMREKL